MAEIVELRTKPIRDRDFYRGMLRETADLLKVLDYANPESQEAAEVQIEAINGVLTGEEISD